MLKIEKKIVDLFARFLLPLEQLLVRRYEGSGPTFSPVFILGPPRTGTTVAFQLLTSCYKTTFPRNLSTDWAPRLPMLVQKLSVLEAGKRKETFQSNYGRTNGLFAQAEGSRFLELWFPGGIHPSYLDPESIGMEQFEGLRRTVAALSNEAGAPFVCKNAWNCFRLQWLHRLFPEAVFVIVRRNIIYSAQSDLEAKIRVKKDVNAWNSASPKEYHEIMKKPYWERVVDQQYYTWRQMLEDCVRLGGERFIEIWYEHLCEHPKEVLGRIETLAGKMGRKMERRECDLSAVRQSNKRKVSEEDFQRISDYADTLGREWITPPVYK